MHEIMTDSFRDNANKSPKIKSFGLGLEQLTDESEKYKYDLTRALA